MYLIHITGVKNPIEVSTDKGEDVKRVLMANPASDQMVEVNGRIFRVSAVKEIEYMADPRSDRVPEPTPMKMTDEERKRVDAMLRTMRKQLEDRGVFKNNYAELHAKWRADGLDVHKECVICNKPLPAHLRRWCSGKCKREEQPVHNLP